MFGFRHETVFEFERALLWDKGKFVRLLEPGRHKLWGKSKLVQRFDARTQLVTLPGQEVLSADGVTLKMSLLVEYRVVDPVLMVQSTVDHYQSVYASAQLALRDLVGGFAIDDVLAQRSQFGAGLLERCAPPVAAVGVEVLRADVKDIMFPGDLKKTFAQVAAAKQEGLAALERARGESAALRNLANSAQLFDDHPNLMQLRLLQQISDSDSNTFVLGDQSLIAPSRSSG